MSVLHVFNSSEMWAAQRRGRDHLGQHLLRLLAAAETGLHELLLPPRGGWYQSVTDPRIQVQSWGWGRVVLLQSSSIDKGLLYQLQQEFSCFNNKSAVEKVIEITLLTLPFHAWWGPIVSS